MNSDALAIHLQAFVPIEIKTLQKQGGPSDWHFEEAQQRMATFRAPEASEALLFPGSQRGLTGKMVGILTEALAVLAFVPGGVRFTGCHFEVPSIPCSWCGRPQWSAHLIEVRDDGNAEPTGTAPVCDDCLEEWSKECSKQHSGTR